MYIGRCVEPFAFIIFIPIATLRGRSYHPRFIDEELRRVATQLLVRSRDSSPAFGCPQCLPVLTLASLRLPISVPPGPPGSFRPSWCYCLGLDPGVWDTPRDDKMPKVRHRQG